MNHHRGSIRAKLLLGLVLFLVGTVVVGAIFYQRMKAPAIDDLLALLPRDAAGFIVIRGLPAMALEFGNLDGELFGDGARESMDADVLEAIEFVERTLKVDLRDVSAIRELGLDITRPAAGTMTMIRAAPVGAFYLPAVDADRLALNLRRLVESDGTAVELEPLGDGEMYVMRSGEELAWTAHGDHVIVAISDDEKRATRLLEDTVQGRDIGIGELSWVTSLDPLIADDWQALFAVNPDLPLEFIAELPRDLRKMMRSDEVERFLRDAEGLATALEISRKTIRVKGLLTSEVGSELRFDEALGAREDKLASRIPGVPLAAGRISIDLSKMFEWLRKEQDVEEDLDKTMRELRRETGVDVEDDLIEYLGSPISFAVFASERSAKIPLGFAAWVPVKKDHRLDRTFRDLRDSLKEKRVEVDRDTVGDAEWYRVSEKDATLGWGVARDHLIFVFGKRLLEDVTTAMDKPSGSYLDEVDSDTKAALLKSGAAAAFLDVDEFVRSFEEILERDRDFREAAPFLSMVNEVLLTSSSTRNAAEMVLEFKSDDGFEKAAEGQWGEETSRRKLRATRSIGPSNVDGIRTAEKAYHAEWDSFTSAPWTPPTLSGKNQPFSGGGKWAFENLGWVADGPTPCRFKVEARQGRSSQTDDFLITAECDADGDGIPSRYQANRAQKAWMVTADDVY
jgi:hypothetical protein